MKYSTLIRYCILALVMVVSFSACKKSGSTSKSIYGQWNEPANPGGYGRGLYFGGDGTFIASFTSYPQPSPAGGTTTLSVTALKGTYIIKGDSLLTTVNTMTVAEGNGSPVITPSSQKLFAFATIKINNNTLLINYTSYPADAPVPTQITFNRLLPD